MRNKELIVAVGSGSRHRHYSQRPANCAGDLQIQAPSKPRAAALGKSRHFSVTWSRGYLLQESVVEWNPRCLGGLGLPVDKAGGSLLVDFVAMIWSQFLQALFHSPGCFPHSFKAAVTVLGLLPDAEAASCHHTDAWLEEITEDLTQFSAPRPNQIYQKYFQNILNQAISDHFEKMHVCISPGSLLQCQASWAVGEHFSAFDWIPLFCKWNWDYGEGAIAFPFTTILPVPADCALQRFIFYLDTAGFI